MARFTLPAARGGPDVAALVIRAVVGVVMAYHGYRKVLGGVSAFVESTIRPLDLPLPALVGYAVVVIELVGGLCLLAGLLTRLWSLLLALQMLAIVFTVKADVGLIAPRGVGVGFELDLLIAACAVALLVMGPGSFSLDRALGLERPPATAS